MAKQNLVYPFMKDIFLLSGSFTSVVLSVLYLKDVFHLLWLSVSLKRFCSILSYFGNVFYRHQKVYGNKYIPNCMAVLY